MRVSVCICTYRRPEQLGLLLDSLAAQTRTPDQVVVTDNHDAQSARAVCESGQWPFPVEYHVEPEQNIALARNRVVAGADGDWIGFLDDDEVAPPDWLQQMLDTAQRFDADGVLGPVISELPGHAPNWIARGDFYARRRFETGTPVPLNELRIGNALLRGDRLRAEPGPFDPAFGRTGGEDGDLLARLARHGAALVWCDEAAVREPVESNRLDLRWLLMRSFRGGQDFGRHFLAERYGPARGLNRMLFCAKAVVALFVCGLLSALCLPLGRHRAVAWLRKAYAQVGKLAAFSSYRYEEYTGAGG